MIFYLPCQGRGYVQDLPKGADLLTWLVDGGLKEGTWHLGRDLIRDGGPLTLELKDEDDIIVFKLKFGHLTIPEPPKYKPIDLSKKNTFKEIVYDFCYNVLNISIKWLK